MSNMIKKNENLKKVKTILKKIFSIYLVELCWHTLCYDLVSIWWSLD